MVLLMSVAGCAEKGKPSSSSPRVKNVILMVGDGMGLAQVTALMLSEEYAPVNMERASVGGFVKTYSANNRVTDSAASGTAYATGEKTNNGHLGVAPDGSPLETILEKAEREGLATGLVVTTTIQHATPGAFYGHTPNRNDYRAIALDLLSSGIDVAIGGGRRYLTDREDGRDLVKELEDKGYFMADSLEMLDGVTAGPAMALYERGLPLVIEGRDPEYLPKATAKALEILTAATPRGGGGFFLMIEGSYIDSAGHDNDAEMLLGEMRDFDAAVGVAFDYADSHPGTLVVVLADHETGGLTIPAGKENFLLPDSGISFEWSTGGHTGTMIPMFAYGAHADFFGGVLDNTEVNHKMEELLGLK
jgi:alkaline phosphatase